MTRLILPESGLSARRLHRQASMYFSRIWWLVRDVASGHMWPIVGVTLVNLVGVAAAFASVGGAFVVVRRLENGEPIAIRGVPVDLGSETRTLVGVAIGIAFLGVLSALSLYYSQWRIERIAAVHQRQCLDRLFHIVADPAFRGWPGLVQGDPRRAISRLAHSAIRMTGLSVIALLQVILPMCTFVAAVIALLWIDAAITAWLLPVAAAYLVPWYLINRGVVHLQRDAVETGAATRQDIDAGLRLTIDTTAPLSTKLDWAAHALKDPAHDRLSHLLSRRRLAVQRMQAVNAIAFTVCVLGLLLFFGLWREETDRPWSELVAYLVALRFAVLAVRQTTSKFIRLSRFLASYRAYTEFVDDAQEISRAWSSMPPQPLDDRLVIRAPDEVRWESDPRLRIAPGETAWILTPERPTHGVLEATAVHLSRAMRGYPDIVAHAATYAGITLDPSRTLRACAIGTQATDEASAAHERAMIDLCFATEIANLPSGLDTRVDDASTAALTEEFRFALGAAALRPGTPVLLLPGTTLSRLDATFVHRLLAYLAPAFTFLVADDPGIASQDTFTALAERTAGAAVMINGEILACGGLDWLARQRSAIFEHFRSIQVVSMSEAETGEDMMDEEA